MKAIGRTAVRVGAVALAMGLAMPVSGASRAEEPPVLEGICSFPITHEFPKFHVAHAAPIPSTHAPFDGFDTGQVKVVVTNVESGESVTLNASSAVFYLWDGTAVFRGSTVAFFDSRRGEVPKGVWLLVGSWRATFDDEGRVKSATGGVIRRDICAELA